MTAPQRVLAGLGLLAVVLPGAAPAQSGPSVAATPTSLLAGQPLTVSWSSVPDPHVGDWIGVYAVGAPSTDPVTFRATRGEASGSFEVAAPTQAGSYELRYFLDGGFTIAATSPPIAVGAAPACDNLTNVRWFECDFGDENDFALERDGTPVCGSASCPGAPGACWSAPVAERRFEDPSGAIAGERGSLGGVRVDHARDVQAYGDTHLVVEAAQTLVVPLEADVGRVWLDDVEVTATGPPGSVTLELDAGSHHLEWTSTNQLESSGFAMDFPFATRVARMHGAPIEWCTSDEVVLSGDGGPIGCGDTITGTLETPTDVDEYTFFAEAGAAVAIETGGLVRLDPFEPCWKLLAPSGATLVTNICGQWWQHLLPETGTYRIQVRENTQSHVGDYALNLEFVSANESCGRAIECGETLVAPLDPIGDADAFRFTAQAGDRVGLSTGEVVATDFGFTSWGQVFTPTGGTQNSLSSNSGPLFPNPLLATGTYTVTLSEINLLRRGVTSLTFQRIGEGKTCGEPITCGSEETVGELEPSGRLDAFQFEANANDVVLIGVREVLDVNTNPNFSPEWRLYAPDASFVALGWKEEPVTLPQTGTYTFLVFDHGGNRGVYGVNLGRIGGGTSCGSPVACGDTIAGRIDYVGDLDTFPFDANAGVFSIAIVDTGGVDFDFEACWEVYGPDAALIGSEGCGTASVTLVQGGRHTIRVADREDDDPGGYSLNVHGVSAGTACGLPMGCGQGATTGSIDPVGDIDAVRFLAEAGDSITLTPSEVEETDPGYSTCFQLFAPNGALLLGKRCAATTVALSQSGIHTVKIFDDNHNQRGLWSLQLAGSCAAACSDGLDGDGDGLVDFPADPGCRDPAFPLENPACQDGVDNDGETGIDFDGGAAANGGVALDVPDPQCAGQSWKNKEAKPTCGLGFEVALLLAPLLARRRRGRRPTRAGSR